MKIVALDGPCLFQRALGQAWAGLPAVTRLVHSVEPTVILDGEADVDGAATVIGRALAKIFGFPEAATKAPVRVVIESDGVGERWARHYPTRTMRSFMTQADPAASTVEERMGGFRFRLKLIGRSDGLDLVPQAVSFAGLPLPSWFLPRIVASERASADGRHLFDVEVSLWPLGRLVHYRGWLRLEKAA